MIRDIVIRPYADRDIMRHVRYLARAASPLVARKFWRALEQTFAQLRRNPGIGAPCEFADVPVSDLRVWPVRRFKNYLIYYQAGEEIVEILHLFHGSEDTKSLIRRCH